MSVTVDPRKCIMSLPNDLKNISNLMLSLHHTKGVNVAAQSLYTGN